MNYKKGAGTLWVAAPFFIEYLPPCLPLAELFVSIFDYLYPRTLTEQTFSLAVEVFTKSSARAASGRQGGS